MTPKYNLRSRPYVEAWGTEDGNGILQRQGWTLLDNSLPVDRAYGKSKAVLSVVDRFQGTSGHL